MHNYMASALSGLGAGAVNGLLGAGGGLILVPALRTFTDVKKNQLFPTSLAITAPLSLVSLAVYSLRGQVPFQAALPYILGGALGGLFAGLWGQKIPVRFLHKILGILILWGGIRSFF